MIHIEYMDYKEGRALIDSQGNGRFDIFESLPFRIQRIVLKPDKEYTKNLFSNAKARLGLSKFNIADSSGVARGDREAKLKGLCGLAVEQVCYDMLNRYNDNPRTVIELDKHGHSKDQIDITVTKKWVDMNGKEQSVVKTVEIRSSFPLKPVQEVILGDFDILGPYANPVKRNEYIKDFYLRFLFNLDFSNVTPVTNEYNAINYSLTATKTLSDSYFDEELRLIRELELYFIGGATKEMMFDDTLSYCGSMQSNNFNKSKGAAFRKMKIYNALDCISILRLVLGAVYDEAKSGK